MLSAGQCGSQMAGVSSHTQYIAGFIPDQSAYLNCGFNSQSGHVKEATSQYFSHQCFSLSLSVSIPLSKSNEKMSSSEDRKKEKN